LMRSRRRLDLPSLSVTFRADFRAAASPGMWRTAEPPRRPSGRAKSLILQGFQPAAGVAKKPLSGYNMSYFPNAFPHRKVHHGQLKIHAPPGDFCAPRPRLVRLCLERRKGARAALGGDPSRFHRRGAANCTGKVY
jgi:hypothetical protein